MKVLVCLLAALALGSANPIGPTTAEPSREDRIKTAIDKNVQWLLSGIKNGTLEGPDLSRAVVALFLAEPGYFSRRQEIGQELKINVTEFLLTHIRLQNGPSNIPSGELALYVQALTVTCTNPRNFFGHDLLTKLWRSGIRSQQSGRRFPSLAFLALCNAEATHLLLELQITPFRFVDLSDEEAVTTMSIDCFQSHLPWNQPSMQRDIRKSGYRYYPSNLTAEKLQELISPDDDPVGNTTSLSVIAAAMQTLMHIRQLQVSDLRSAVDFLLNSQDEDGSWGQSTLNSYFILPVLSKKSFLNIRGSHCPSYRRQVEMNPYPPYPEEYESLENETESREEARNTDYIRWIINLGNDSAILNRNYSNTMYDLLVNDPGQKAIYHNGTDGKPYLTSLQHKKNRPDYGYMWNTYEIAMNPNGTMTRLTQSHADIKLRRGYRYILWFSHRSEQEDLS